MVGGNLDREPIPVDVVARWLVYIEDDVDFKEPEWPEVIEDSAESTDRCVYPKCGQAHDPKLHSGLGADRDKGLVDLKVVTDGSESLSRYIRE